MLAKIKAFFARPSVQDVIRHVAVTAAAAAVGFVVVHGVAGAVTAAGAAGLIRAVWVAIRPVVIADVPAVAPVVEAVDPAPAVEPAPAVVEGDPVQIAANAAAEVKAEAQQA